MATPINFPGKNANFAENQPEYQPLPSIVIDHGHYAEVLSCWQFDAEEIKRFNETGKLYLKQILPIAIDGEGNRSLTQLQPLMPMVDLGDDLILHLPLCH